MRGHRIELGEIEAALSAHPDVARAAVSVVGTGTGTARELVAAVVLAGSPATTALPQVLRRRLEDRLPHTMVPRRIVTQPAIPLTANGQVDRRAVTAAVTSTSARPTGEAEATPHLGPVQRSVAQLWESVLGVPVRTPEDSFFSLGGDSVKAVRLVERAVTVLGVRLPLARFFTRPTVDAFAAAARAQASSAPCEAVAMEEGVL